jgi:menaquinone-9 beta-reductase
MELAYDLAVVGAGPAGAATAIRAKQLRPDARVVLLDRTDFPRDKPCGDGLSAHSIVELATLGALSAVEGSRPVRDLRLRSPYGVEVVAPPPQACVVVPRAVFDGRLVELALARGIEFRRHRVRTIEQRPHDVVIDGELTAGVVVGADGANSVARRALGVAANHPRDVGIAVRGYVDAMPGSVDELVIVMEQPGSLAYAWAFPLPDGGANVGYGRSVEDARADGGSGTDHLAGRLRRLLPISGAIRELRAHRLPLASAAVRQPDGRVLLAGDALSYVNPITGEGIHHALRTGRLAAEVAMGALARGAGDPGAVYRAVLRSAFGKHLRQSAGMARLCKLPGFVDAAFDLASRRGDVWASICDMGLGSGTISARLIACQVGAYAAWQTRHGGPAARRPALPPPMRPAQNHVADHGGTGEWKSASAVSTPPAQFSEMSPAAASSRTPNPPR